MSILSRTEPKNRSPHDRSRSEAEKSRGNRVAVSGYCRRKRALDCLLAALLLIPGLPIIGLLALLVRLTSRGPAIYRQSRVGRDGRTFMLLKIRTMTVDAEAGTGAVWAKKGDRRVTRIGRVLRRLHLDEFPQLFNVLRGEMSLVGPRPERPEFVEILEKAVPHYRERLAVLPGVTGLAQLNLPPDTHLCSVCRKVDLDRDYVEQASLWLDVRILAFTMTWLVRISGDRQLRLFGLARTPRLEHCTLGPEGPPTGDSGTTADGLKKQQCLVTRRINGHDSRGLLSLGLPQAGSQVHPPVNKPR